jgi:hypothetical protein
MLSQLLHLTMGSVVCPELLSHRIFSKYLNKYLLSCEQLILNLSPHKICPDIFTVAYLLCPELLVLNSLSHCYHIPFYKIVLSSPLSKGQNTSLTSLSLPIRKMFYSLSPCFHQPRGGRAKWLGRVLPCPFSPAWGHRMGDNPFNKTFITVPALLSLSTVSQGGDREFNWSGSLLMFVLTHAKVGTSDMVQSLQMTWRLLILMNVLVSLLLHKTSYSYPILTLICPYQFVDVSCPYPPVWVLLHHDGPLVLLPTEVLGG